MPPKVCSVGWLGGLLSFRESRQKGSWRWEITESEPVRIRKTTEYEAGTEARWVSTFMVNSRSVWEIELAGSWPACQSGFLPDRYRIDND